MNELRSFCFLLVIASTIIGLQGCGSTKVESSKNLVVMEQTDTVYGSHEEDIGHMVAFNVDIPVNGPQALMDSLMVFVNKQLYDACESNVHFDEKVVTFNREEMFIDDGEQLLSHYMVKYKPLIQDSLWRTFGLTMKMEAQTEKYVTYGLEFFYCGGGCSSDKFYYAFDKSDGHLIKEIISRDNLVRYFKDNPEYATNDEYSWEFNPDDHYLNSCYGLLEDSFSLVILGERPHYFSVDIPLNRIFSYLSPEVQALLEQRGDDALIVERQECVLKHFKHLTGEIYPITVAIDIPIAGSEILLDSIATFFNENLYTFFDNDKERHLPYEKVVSKDVKRLLKHYREAYSPFFQTDSTEEHEFATDCLEIKLVAQTSTYVTYEVNNIFYGEGIETAKEWVTFSKSDGHRLNEIISNNEMMRFYREEPQLRSENIWEYLHNHWDEEKSPHDIVCSVGLLNDSLVHQYVYTQGIFEDVKYPLNKIAPYLSKEVQNLIKK